MIILNNNTERIFMTDHIEFTQEKLIQISPEIKYLLNQTREKMKGMERRQFMAHVVLLMGEGGQRRAKKELGWDRDTIRKGMKELKSGIICIDNFSGRGRKRTEEKLLFLLEDIKSIIEPDFRVSRPGFEIMRLNRFPRTHYIPLIALVFPF
jgi:hypothetical protein